MRRRAVRNYKKVIENKHVEIRLTSAPELGIKNYLYVHEKRIGTVAVLPFYGDSYLLRNEISVLHNNQQLGVLRGGIEENESIVHAAIRELYEESGYVISEQELMPLGSIYESRNSDSTIYMFACDLTNKQPSEMIGDGSVTEAIAHCVWVHESQLNMVNDPIVCAAVIRLCCEN